MTRAPVACLEEQRPVRHHAGRRRRFPHPPFVVRRLVPAVAGATLLVTATGASLGAHHSGASLGADSGAPAAAAASSLGAPGRAAAGPAGSSSRAPGTGARVADRRRAVIEAALARARAEARQAAERRASRARHRLALARVRARAAAHRWVPALERGRLSSGFGMRWGRLHAGIDLAARTGTPLRAMSSGRVVVAGPRGGYGTKVEIRYWDGTVSDYGHLSRVDVAAGDLVTPGQRVGAVGSTGFSTGPHLHLEVHPRGESAVNPVPWLARHGLG